MIFLNVLIFYTEEFINLTNNYLECNNYILLDTLECWIPKGIVSYIPFMSESFLDYMTLIIKSINSIPQLDKTIVQPGIEHSLILSYKRQYTNLIYCPRIRYVCSFNINYYTWLSVPELHFIIRPRTQLNHYH